MNRIVNLLPLPSRSLRQRKERGFSDDVVPANGAMAAPWSSRLAMVSARPIQIGVESSRSRANQEPMAAPYPNDAPGKVHDTVLGKFEKPSVGDEERSRFKPVSAADRRHVDLEIAHQALDDLGAQAILCGQPVASRSRQLSVRDRSGPLSPCLSASSVRFP